MSILPTEYLFERDTSMDSLLMYALSLFALLPDKDQDEIITLMLSSPSLQLSSSGQTETVSEIHL